MANLYTRVETVSNAGATVATYGANALKNVISQSDAGAEFILSITAAAATLTDAKLNACIAYLTTSHGTSGTGDSSGVIASIGTSDSTAFASGTDTVVFVRYQTTDAFVVTGVNAAATDTVVAIIARMAPAN